MARITIEDCTEKVPNRFHLVQMASIRTKQLKKGARPLVSAEENKAVVVSLREIAAGYIKPDYPDAETEAEAMTEIPDQQAVDA
jgi:DNA-directed RNA polymerase subunit omega